MLKFVCVCGARPNFMKIAPVCRALTRSETVELILVHTGQHYDERMSKLFFDELNIPQPDVNLGVGSGTHAFQTAEIMKRFEPVCVERRPDWVVVVGDVNSTLACALVAAKLGIQVAHVEAGLRSFDRSMPEETNRILTDAVSALLFVTEPSGVENLRREGVAERRIHFVGNVMIDTLIASRRAAEASQVLTMLNLAPKQYGVVTLHRPSNVDDPAVFSGILDALESIATELPLIYPVHPRVRRHLAASGPKERIERVGNLRIMDPLGYLDFLKLMSAAAVVLTDSGGIQEETTFLGVPCLTLRANTERPITLKLGTNRLTGTNCAAILSAYREVRDRPPTHASMPELWDGRASERIAACLLKDAQTRNRPSVTSL